MRIWRVDKNTIQWDLYLLHEWNVFTTIPMMFVPSLDGKTETEVILDVLIRMTAMEWMEGESWYSSPLEWILKEFLIWQPFPEEFEKQLEKFSLHDTLDECWIVETENASLSSNKWEVA